MIVFSILISFSVAFIDQANLKSKLIDEFEAKLELTEEMVLMSLHSIDKAYQLFDEEIAKEMKRHSEKLLKKYKENPHFEQWDFQELKQQLAMEVYIINTENVITYSSLDEDVGLDFQECCKKFSQILDYRRNKDEFVHDGMDLHQKSGKIMKYSYVPTSDHLYLIELGYELGEEEIFKQFNFLDVITQLESKYEAINAIHVYNSGGFILGEQEADQPLVIPEERRAIFEQAVKTRKVAEIEGTWNEQAVYYKYIPYEASKKRGLSTYRVIELIYNEDELNQVLADYRRYLIVQLLVILIVAIIVSYLIGRWLERPMYLAFHDSLTGLKNRAAFEDILEELLKKKDANPALMIVDLDNFKLVNDRLGHGKGDYLLAETAKIIHVCAGKGNVSARLGGDEFVVVIPNSNEEEIVEIAAMMIEKMNDLLILENESDRVDVTISIGIAFADGDDMQALYKKADIALYESKKNGKNQYQIYRD